jgi:hypothetical protein
VRSVKDLKKRAEAFIDGDTPAAAAPVAASSPASRTPVIQVKRWPFFGKPAPLLVDGRTDLSRTLQTRMTDQLWLSVDAHCCLVGAEKSAWVRDALQRQMELDQEHIGSKPAKTVRS